MVWAEEMITSVVGAAICLRVSRDDQMTRKPEARPCEGGANTVAGCRPDLGPCGGRYDLTSIFLSQYLSFPFGRHDNLIDAISRIYDTAHHSTATPPDILPLRFTTAGSGSSVSGTTRVGWLHTTSCLLGPTEGP